MTSSIAAATAAAVDGSRRWATIARSAPAIDARTWLCSSGGNMSIRRSIVLAADGVLIVASTRWPVSEAVSAISTVSRSRSSPITMTSGSSRSDALSAVAKLRV